MTLPECHFQPNDPLRKVLQQVEIPTAYVTFLCFVLCELLWLLAALALALPLPCSFNVTLKFGDFKGYARFRGEDIVRRADSGLSAAAVLYVVGVLLLHVSASS
jgi:hydrogenase/urease accessory protein HupE